LALEALAAADVVAVAEALVGAGAGAGGAATGGFAAVAAAAEAAAALSVQPVSTTLLLTRRSAVARVFRKFCEMAAVADGAQSTTPW